MAEELTPDGQSIYIGNVEVSALGIGGNVEVFYPTSAGLRAGKYESDEFQKALEDCDFFEQLTVEVSNPVHYPSHYTSDTRGRDTRAAQLSVVVPGPGTGLGQIMLVCDEDGVVSWNLPQNISPGEIELRSGEQRMYKIQMDPIAETSHGRRGIIGAVGKKLLKIFTFRLIDKVVGKISDYFVSRWEEKNRPHRIQLFSPENYQNPDRSDITIEEFTALGTGPALLFIHGTLSQAHSAFGAIPLAIMKDLYEHYEGRVFAFEHPTVSITPLDNAKWFVQHLPADILLNLDIISHSRGGLVGRVLCEQTGNLNSTHGSFNIRRLIMVATPNKGTPLADREHLGSLIDTFTNMLNLVPDNPITDTMEVILTVLKQMAVGAMGGLDGLMAMNPEGEFLKVLNEKSTVKVETVYNAVASDYEPGAIESLARYARDRITDVVFKGVPNDLVVPTAGVYEANGSRSFPIDNPVIFDAGEAIDHSSFWRHGKTQNAFTRWLKS